MKFTKLFVAIFSLFLFTSTLVTDRAHADASCSSPDLAKLQTHLNSWVNTLGTLQKIKQDELREHAANSSVLKIRYVSEKIGDLLFIAAATAATAGIGPGAAASSSAAAAGSSTGAVAANSMTVAGMAKWALTAATAGGTGKVLSNFFPDDAKDSRYSNEAKMFSQFADMSSAEILRSPDEAAKKIAEARSAYHMASQRVDAVFDQDTEDAGEAANDPMKIFVHQGSDQLEYVAFHILSARADLALYGKELDTMRAWQANVQAACALPTPTSHVAQIKQKVKKPKTSPTFMSRVVESAPSESAEGTVNAGVAGD